jgi:hypothetical protein
MAGILIHDVSGYPGEEYNLKIPSLTDTANIQEAMMLFHYGIDNYDGTGQPAAQSVFGNLKDFDDRIAALEETEVVALAGTANQITASGSVGNVTVSLPSTIITPGTLSTTSHLSVGGSASFTGNVSLSGSASIVGNTTIGGTLSITGSTTINNNLLVTQSGDFDGNLVVGSGSANYLNVTGSASFSEGILARKGINVFGTTTARDTAIPSPSTGTIVYITALNQQLVWNGVAWIAIEGGSGMEDIFLMMGA